MRSCQTAPFTGVNWNNIVELLELDEILSNCTFVRKLKQYQKWAGSPGCDINVDAGSFIYVDQIPTFISPYYFTSDSRGDSTRPNPTH